MTKINTLHDCYRAIVRASESRVGQRGQMIDYAYSYAKHGLTLPDASRREFLTPEARVQALYARTNLSGWRGETAKEVRATLDRIIARK